MSRPPVSEFLKRPCPHCGKLIPTLPKCPRDYALFLNCLLYRVPVEAELTPAWIETVRLHCKMNPARLRQLQDPDGPHARHWPRLLERRAARLEHFRKTGEIPPSWRGLMEGEPDHLIQLQASHEYRKGGLAKMKAKLRNRPEAVEAKHKRRVLDMERVRSKARHDALVDEMTANLVAEMGAAAGTISLPAYKLLEGSMLDRKKHRATSRPQPDTGRIHLSDGETVPAQGEGRAPVLQNQETP